MDISSQIVLITGSSRGLGASIARAFHSQGARVIINYVQPSSQPLAEELVRSLISAAAAAAANSTSTLCHAPDCANSRTPPQASPAASAVAIKADITNPGEVAALFTAAEHHFKSPITTVVNNALVHYKFNGDSRKKIDTLSWEEDVLPQLTGSVRGTLNTTQSALPHFQKLNFGRIINIGSNLVSNPVVPYHDYTAGKGALLALTRTMAKELGMYGVTVNMVSGGLLRGTDASSETPEEVYKAVEGVTPLGRVMGTEDVAGVVVFFAGRGAGGVTGQNINVDGGLVMG